MIYTFIAERYSDLLISVQPNEVPSLEAIKPLECLAACPHSTNQSRRVKRAPRTFTEPDALGSGEG